MANFIPMEDGVTHLNAYSGAKTELGRFLSNFAYCPIETEDGRFNSVEGYWGWLSIPEDNPRREELRGLSGFAAKQRTKELLSTGRRRFETRFSEKIAAAIHAKFQTDMARRVLGNNEDLLSLPIVHYYARKTNTGTQIEDVTDKYPEFIENVRREVRAYLDYRENLKKEANEYMNNLNQKPSLFGISEGVICQQVNCQDVMGAGLARAIMDKYPQVSERYHETFKRNSKESLFGKVDLVKLSDTLYVANIYSQFNYGNPARTGKVYTNAEKLTKAVDSICKKLPHLPVYLPHSTNLEGKEEYGIGCGYGGETWGRLAPMFEALGHENLHLLDTKTSRIHELNDHKEVDFIPSSKSASIVGLSFMESFDHVENKYPSCKGMDMVGETMEQFQADIAAKYGYKPLPTDVQSKALDVYLANLPEEFMPTNRGFIKPAKGGVEIAGKRQPIVLKDGTKIANGYDRIVVGNYGAFIEIDERDMVKEPLTTRKGEEYRERGDYRGKVKYFWKTVGDTEAKIYEQQKGVSYADYKAGKYYISPYEVMGRGEVKSAGFAWNEEFIPLIAISKPDQVSMRIDPSLYNNRPVVFDLETTGFSSAKGDEILQIAVVNDQGQVLMNVYTGTTSKKSWPDAEAVHHISPRMVAGKPVAACYADALSEIFEKASKVVGHNVSFDLRFVKDTIGVEVDNRKVHDTCTHFKRDYPGAKHYKLGDAIKEYCPEQYGRYAISAHDALTDATATAAVFSSQMTRIERYEREKAEMEEMFAKEDMDM